MPRKLTLLVGLGAGYVLGTRSGRQRYEQIKGAAQRMWHDPRVQEKAGQAGHVAKEKVSGVAGLATQAVKEKVSSRSGDHSGPRPEATSDLGRPEGGPGTGTLS